MIEKSYAQQHEDLIIDYLLGYSEKGFYIDIGANDPELLSNTKRFYDRGWTGINIEPNPEIFFKFPLERPRDTNLNIGIGDVGSHVPFYIKEPHQFSSFHKNTWLDDIRGNARVVGTRYISIKKLSTILPKDREIDFVSIDTEGYEMKVLQSHHWDTARPKVLIIELSGCRDEVKRFMLDVNYRMVHENTINGIFVDVGVQ